MKISVSSLAFTGPFFCDMAELPKDVGIEIFCEWGSDGYWEKAVPFVMDGRTGNFSMHAPFEYYDLSSPHEDGDALISYLTSRFALYKKLGSDSYVIHTNEMYPSDITDEEIAVRQKTAEARLLKLDRIAKDAGVRMLVENLGWGISGRTLYDQESFTDLFRRHPELDCIIDVGHAIVEHFDVEALQKELGSRVRAYHLHNNDGLHDSHRHLRDGVYDYAKFVRNAKKYTPDATLVLEYAYAGSVAEVADDIDYLKSLLRE